VPVVPSASVVRMMRAPAASVQPVPANESGLSPGASEYRLRSPIERNGWVSAGAEHAEVSVEADRPVENANLLPAIAGPAGGRPTPAPERLSLEP
jgi:hypothetical protein